MLSAPLNTHIDVVYVKFQVPRGKKAVSAELVCLT